MTDFRTSGWGSSVILITPVSDAAEAWVEQNVQTDQWLGGAFAVEPRYAGAILEGAAAEGLTTE